MAEESVGTGLLDPRKCNPGNHIHPSFTIVASNVDSSLARGQSMCFCVVGDARRLVS